MAMKRKLAVGVFVSSALFSAVSGALGLGQGKIHSALNQPLEARIELLGTAGFSPEDLLVGLAPKEDFNRLNIQHSYLVSSLQFELKQEASGQLYVDVTSDRPVKEPFLDFLVEVIWPNGRVLREYTFLVDPPAFTSQRAAPVAAPVASRPEPVRAAPVSAPEPVRPTASRAIPSSGRTYQVAPNDNLWNIAKQNRPDNETSIQQTMLAIQDLNPEAFIRGNINRLRQGVTLEMPSSAHIRRRSEQQAVSEVAWQNSALTDPGAARPTPVDARPEEPVTPAVSLDEPDTDAPPADKEALAATEETVPEVTEETVDSGAQAEASAEIPEMIAGEEVSGEPEAELKVMAGEIGPSATTEPAGSQTGDQEAPSTAAVAGGAVDSDESLEELDRLNRENAELQDRLQAIESQLATVQTLLALKDEQLAAMEKMAAEQAPAADSDSGLMAELRKNPLYQAIAAGVAVLFAGGLLMALRRKRKESEAVASTEGDDSTPGAEVAEEKPKVGNIPARVTSEGLEAEEIVADTSLEEDAADILGEEAGASENVIDAVEEADIYLVYGRYEQAEELLRGAIERHPERTDLRVKLMESLARSGKAESFDEEYERLRSHNDPHALETANQLRTLFDSEDSDQVSDRPHVASTEEIDIDMERPEATDVSGGGAPAEDTSPGDEEKGEESLAFDIEKPEADAEGIRQGEGLDMDDIAMDFDLADEDPDAVSLDESVSDDWDDSALEALEGQEPEDNTGIAFELEDDELEGESKAALEKEALAELDSSMLSDLESLSDADITTQLDLARSLVESGDNATAREYLEAVKANGNDAQRREAKQLLKSLK